MAEASLAPENRRRSSSWAATRVTDKRRGGKRAFVNPFEAKRGEPSVAQEKKNNENQSPDAELRRKLDRLAVGTGDPHGRCG
jgi:hypothetical protein